MFITWTFNGGNKAVNVVTVSPTTTNVNAAYQGRVSVNSTNGFLTLMSLKAEDTGDYSISMISTDGSTTADDTQLQVLSESCPPSILTAHLCCHLPRDLSAGLFLFLLF